VQFFVFLFIFFKSYVICKWIVIFHLFLFNDFFWVVVVGFELRDSHLLDKCSTTWATHPAIFSVVLLDIGSHSSVRPSWTIILSILLILAGTMLGCMHNACMLAHALIHLAFYLLRCDLLKFLVQVWNHNPADLSLSHRRDDKCMPPCPNFCMGWPQTESLSSASQVSRITDESHQCPASSTF
jgi:hypothetical protein